MALESHQGCVLAWPAGLLIHHLASGHPAICHQLWWPGHGGPACLWAFVWSL